MGLNNLLSFVALTRGSQWKKASKCKSLIKQLKHRLFIHKNRRNAIIRQLHSDIVQLLQLGHHQAALERVEQLYNDKLILTTYDEVDKFCDCVISNLSDISSNSSLSDDVCEAVASLIFAASRCGELPELQSIRILFKELLGQKFERANVELLPANRVNSRIKHNLSKTSVSGDLKIQLLNEIATKNKNYEEPRIKVPFSEELPEAEAAKCGCWSLASSGENGINAQHQASNFKEILKRVGSRFFLKDGKNMVTYWSNIPAGTFTSAKTNATVVQKQHPDGDIKNKEKLIHLQFRSTSLTVSASKAQAAVHCLHDKGNQAPKREDFRGRQEPDALESCMNFQRSKKREVNEGNFKGMTNQALQNTKAYNSQNAGDIRVRTYEDKDKKINSPVKHVHPKLPDYDDLITKFRDLKKDKMMRSSTNGAVHDWFCR